MLSVLHARKPLVHVLIEARVGLYLVKIPLWKALMMIELRTASVLLTEKPVSSQPPDGFGGQLTV